MFLGEVALGKEHRITTDDPSLKSPPPGFDSVIAQGQTEPGEPQKLGRSTAKSGVDIRDWGHFRKEDSRERRMEREAKTCSLSQGTESLCEPTNTHGISSSLQGG